MNISKATIQRLPKYLRILQQKQKDGILNISSTSIANELKLNPIQVRKDLACIYKQDGKPGVGFDISKLLQDISDFLDLKESNNILIAGAGRLGQALMNYTGFENEINKIIAIDNDTSKIDNDKIFNIKNIDRVIKDNNINVGIITVPKQVAQEVCDKLISNGVRTIWNFAPTNLKVPDNINIKNEDLSASLALLLNGLKK